MTLLFRYEEKHISRHMGKGNYTDLFFQSERGQNYC